MKKCCVCKSSRQDAIMHHFPCDETRLKKWLLCLNRSDLNNLASEELSKLFVCQKHFEKRFITTSATSLRSRITGKAYPSLFTEEEITSGIPTKENAENSDPRADHTYTRKRHYDHSYSRVPLKEVSTASDPNNFQTMPGISQPSTSQAFEASTASDPNNFQTMPGTSQIPSTSQASEVIASGSSQFQKLPDISHIPSTIEDSGVNKSKTQKQSGSKKRLIKRLKDLTPTGKMIYKEYKKSKKQANFYRRAKRALQFSKEESFNKLTENMNPYAKRIMHMQINLCKKSKKGRRFSTEEKLIALSIMKQSPKGYRFLHKMFILPSRSTLNKMVAKLNVQTGICPQVFDLVKKEVAEWDEKKKLCSLVFDEMSLETALTYDTKRDTINGFVELNEKKKRFADHALVFMLRGAVYKWQQPLAFYYCEGATSGMELKIILKDVVSAVVDCGLKPIAVICDQGAAFQSALNSLKNDTKREKILANKEPDGTVTISGVDLSIIYDPPHLIKGLRNNFLNKNIIVDGKMSKWSDIVDVYKTDCHHTEARLLHKLNDQHIIPEKIKKMKVKNCTKVFSTTVSAALSYTAQFSHYADGRPVSDTLQNTADTVLFFDKLFDSVNGAATFSKKNKGKPLRKAVTDTSEHHEFWSEAIEKLKKIKFVDATGKQTSVPSLKNFITTLESYQRLWRLLKQEGITIMRPRYFNSDPVENFFGQVRAYNYRNNDPSCHSFNCTFKSLLITRIIKFHKDTFNCEDDPAEQVLTLKALFNEEENVEPGHPRRVEVILEQARRERMNVHSRAFTAGWVVGKIVEKLRLKCASCKKSLIGEKSTIHDWISHREYTKAKNSLNYPSEGAVRCFSTVISETNEYLEEKAHVAGVSANIKAKISSKYSFDFVDCAEHQRLILDHFIDITVRFTIMNWCAVINKILRGTDIVRLENRTLPTMQKMALNKFNKKLKNKKINK